MPETRPSPVASVAIGSTRNLTQAFVKYRGDAKRARISFTDLSSAAAGTVGDKATAKLLGAALGSDVELAEGPSIAAGYAPRWMQASEGIRGEMLVLKERMAKLSECHKKALLVSFDEGGGAAGVQVDALTCEVQLGFKRLDAQIRGITQQGGSGGDGGDAAVQLQVQRQLAQALFRLSVEFRKDETGFLSKIKAQRGLDACSSIRLAEEEAWGSGGPPATDPGITDEQLQQVAQATALVDERDAEIRKVVEAITELAQIMQDLSTLVVEQGTMLDRIDHNVTEAAMKIDAGVKELVKAEQTQRGGQACQCIAVLCALITLFLIITIVRHA